MTIISWNVNGIRAVIKKGFIDFLNKSKYDIFCLQEIKARQEQVEIKLPSGFKEYWNLKEYFLYDPSYKKNSILPKKSFDCSICIDVLEHIPSQDLSWVIKEILRFTNKIAFFNIACFSAFAVLHNGENAHITIKDPRGWHGFFSSIMQDYPEKKLVCYCTLKDKDGKRKYYAFSINDNFKKYDNINFIN